MENLTTQDLVWINLALTSYHRTLQTSTNTFAETKAKCSKELMKRASNGI